MTELEGFDRNLATLLIGVDALLGGDSMYEGGQKRLIVDSWTSNARPPEIYDDGLAKRLREIGGVRGIEDKETANEFEKRYQLSSLPVMILTDAAGFDPDRKQKIRNLVTALEVMLKTALAQANGTDIPSYQERYMAATTSSEVRLATYKDERELLRDALARTGFEVTNSRALRETFLAWEHDRGNVPPERFVERAQEKIELMIRLTRSRLLPIVSFGIHGYRDDMTDLSYKGHNVKTVSGVDYTGFNVYVGGEESGKPKLRGIFEYNTGHPMSEPGLLHLASHEVVPGHYLNMMILDLLRRDGRLGFESTINTMCTPSVGFQEGWAESAFHLLFGSREDAIEVLGNDLAVVLTHHDLQSIAKHDVSQLFQLHGWSIGEIRDYVANTLAQTDAIVKKMSGSWSKHPIFGPMYGPAYITGARIVRNAIKDVSVQKVARVGFHLDGEVDIQTFQDKVYRKSA